MVGNVFAAIRFDEEAIAGLEAYRDRVLEYAPRTHTTRPESWHITLAFLGKLTAHETDRAARVLEAFSGKPFTLCLGGFGTFGRGSRRVLWIGVDKSPELADCQRRLQRAYEETGFALPERSFSPHITMSYRWDRKASVSLEALRAEMPLIEVPVSQIVLLRTELDEGRNNCYAPLAYAPLV